MSVCVKRNNFSCVRGRCFDTKSPLHNKGSNVPGMLKHVCETIFLSCVVAPDSISWEGCAVSVIQVFVKIPSHSSSQRVSGLFRTRCVLRWFQRLECLSLCAGSIRKSFCPFLPKMFFTTNNFVHGGAVSDIVCAMSKFQRQDQACDLESWDDTSRKLEGQT